MYVSNKRVVNLARLTDKDFFQPHPVVKKKKFNKYPLVNIKIYDILVFENKNYRTLSMDGILSSK